MKQVAQADKPWRFTEELETHRVDARQLKYLARISFGALVLPYPPEQVECVLIEQNGRQETIFMNYYSDKLW